MIIDRVEEQKSLIKAYLSSEKEKIHTKKQIYFVIISANGIQKTLYSEEWVGGVITLADLYKE